MGSTFVVTALFFLKQIFQKHRKMLLVADLLKSLHRIELVAQEIMKICFSISFIIGHGIYVITYICLSD